MRQTWKGINELIGSYKKENKRNPTNFIRANPNEVPTSDPKEISNILNKYFATVGSKRASKILQTISTFFDYLDPPLNRTFSFDPIIPEDINLEISILQDNKPISLLSIYNRIFEKLMYSRLTKSVKDCNILYDQQYGLVVNTVLSLSILDIVNTILQNMDNGKFSCGVFVDLKKAFDTVNQEILLAKLENYSVRGVINSWFRSHLTDRKQNTEVNNVTVVSGAETTLCGVPEGTVL